jgi:hypothetical protein
MYWTTKYVKQVGAVHAVSGTPLFPPGVTIMNALIEFVAIDIPKIVGFASLVFALWGILLLLQIRASSIMSGAPTDPRVCWIS